MTQQLTEKDLKDTLSALSKLNLDEMFIRENISKWKSKQQFKPSFESCAGCHAWCDVEGCRKLINDVRDCAMISADTGKWVYVGKNFPK